MTITDPALYFRPESRWSAINRERDFNNRAPFFMNYPRVGGSNSAEARATAASDRCCRKEFDQFTNGGVWLHELDCPLVKSWL